MAIEIVDLLNMVIMLVYQRVQDGAPYKLVNITIITIENLQGISTCFG